MKGTQRVGAYHVAFVISQITGFQMLPADSENFIGNGRVIPFKEANKSLRSKLAQLRWEQRRSRLKRKFGAIIIDIRDRKLDPELATIRLRERVRLSKLCNQ